ncbi:MAG: bifunctional [glutamine synthetase] adenylyltransferase/[glutamine synthetase]-adenylyl-L-tyrosine phosphorylase [Microbacteriaceae bacterium]|nr:bifunctional [glutamine synthetase] adenylyltransferase/[glutamine synthetase]-adenylyl-L-tyrosine phosphorylase [Microbacteriaceae bacterium]
MPRTPSTLSSLARAGFARLDDARERLDRLGYAAEDFSLAPDPDLAVKTIADLHDKNPSALAKLWANNALKESLVLLAGASSGLGDFLRRHPDQWDLVGKPLASLPDAQSYRTMFQKFVAKSSGEEAAMALRIAYRRELSRLALWDTRQAFPVAVVDQVARALADMASAALDCALDIARAHHGWSAEDVPLAIIGMGKAGASELNYLSDVDVIYVTEVPEGQDSHDVVRRAELLARDTARYIMEFGVEPGLWEVDPNLRPEGKDGALVRTLESHIAYYQRWAHDWEFQALIKARPLAGDRELGARYRDAVELMIWQASTRPGFVEQVQRMRERVTAHIPPDQVDFQIKLGPGGLRDIEFTIQLLQLVHGAQDASVRNLDTLGALQALSDAGYVGRSEAAEFDHAYRTLRVLEHRIQLGALKRSHVMPRDEESLRVLARHTKLADTAEGLVDQWRGIQRSVRSLHERLFYRPLLSAVASLDDHGVELSSEQAALRLQASGFLNPVGALNHIAALTQGVSRSAAIQRTLLPVLLKWLAEGTDPDGGLLAFRKLSDDLGEAFWFLRMLRDSSGAAQRLMTVLGTSAFVGKLFGRVPEGAAWLDNDEDLEPRELASLRDEVTATLERHQDNEDLARKALRGFRRRELLRIALSSMVAVSDIERVGQALTDLSRAFLEGVLALARADAEGIEFAMIAMGRLGGSELSFGSDLDVVYVFRDIGAGDNAHVIAEGIVKDVARLSEDLLFPVDLDAGLRPEGKNGPIVRSLDAYAAYYERWALGWEAQALLRAAEYVGDESLTRDFLDMAAPYRYPESWGEDKAREIRRIKARVEAERLPQGVDGSRHLKLGRGSLSDVEWAVQLLQLRHGHTHPEIRTASTLGALAVLEECGLLQADDAAQLRDAWLLASRIRTALALFGEPTIDVLPGDRAGLEGAARLMGYPPRSASVLEENYLKVTRRSRVVFERVFYETPA